MQLRKQKEKEFHNKVRNKELRAREVDYKHLTSNRRFYSVARKSGNFINDWLLARCKEKKVLDYCCGDGETSFFLARNGEKAIGIDISSVSVQNCTKVAEIAGLKNNASFFVMDAENLEFKDDYFDFIICNGVLHHLDIKKAYPELARVLKSGGKIICGEPLVYNPIPSV